MHEACCTDLETLIIQGWLDKDRRINLGEQDHSDPISFCPFCGSSLKAD